MKRTAAIASLPFATFIATASFAEDKPLFVYVSPNPIGVNDFLKLGKIGAERVAEGARGRRQDLRKHRSDDAAPEPRGRGQGWR